MLYLQTTNLFQFEFPIMIRNNRILSLAISLLAIVLIGTATAGHHAKSETAEPKKAKKESTSTEIKNTMVTIKTNMGEIQLELDADKAPLSVANFIQYAKDGHYDGVIFHRVIPNFMIQGGGFDPAMEQKPTRAPVVNEANNGLKNDKYTVAMARTQDPHSASAQFFINTKDNDFLNHSSETTSGWGYAVFGKVTAGNDVVDAVEKVETGQVGPYGDVPKESVVIESVTVAE